MKRIGFLLGLTLCLGSVFAQNSGLKKLKVDELMSDRSLYPDKFSAIRWATGTTPELLYIWKNNLIRYNAKSQKTDTILSLEGFNSLMKGKFPNREDYRELPHIAGFQDEKLILSFENSYYVFRLKTGEIEQYCSFPEQAENLTFSRNSGHLAYTRENNLYVIKDGVKFAVTKEEDLGIVNGQAVHRNEFGIDKGVFWAPSGQKLAFYRMDETMVGQYPLLEVKDPDHTRPQMIRYPEAGKKTHKVSVGVYDLNTFQTVFLETYSGSEDMYITGVTWAPAEDEIYTMQLNRTQKHLWVFCHDAVTGKIKRTLFEEMSDVYVEPEAPLIFRPGHPDEFLWASERSGYNHLYLYDIHGKLIKEVTPASEAWELSSLVGLSADGKFAYFMGTKDSPLQQNLYSANIDNGQISRLTKENGQHQISMSPNGDYFIDIYSNTQTPCNTCVIDKNGKGVKEICKSRNPLENYNLPQVRISTIKAADGSTNLHTRMILPPHFDSTKKYPVIIYVYGGPHTQLITDSWLFGGNLFFYFLAQEGFIVYTVDSRGSAHRGFVFESCIQRHLGKVEMADQMQGVAYLKSLPYVDASRLGVDGWSYGGFVTLSLKLKHPGVFKVATAGGPVVNWAWYEIMYGERYMGTPDDNPVGYQEANLLRNVDSLQGKLMLIHGGLDGTVLPKNSLSFMSECIKKAKPVDFFLYPNHEHNVRGLERAHLYRKLYDYYKANL